MSDSTKSSSEVNTTHNFVFQHPDHQWKPNFDKVTSQQEPDTNSDQPSIDSNQQDTFIDSSGVGKLNVDWDDLASQFEQNVSMTPAEQQQTRRQQAFQSFKAPLTDSRGSQEERRRRALELQKMSRQNTLNTRRRRYSEKDDDEQEGDDGTSSSSSNSSDEEADEENVGAMDAHSQGQEQHQSMKRGRGSDDEAERMEEEPKIQKRLGTPPVRTTKKKGKRKKNKRKLEHQGNAVMYGESMDEVPHDLHENWVVMPYPVGKRCTLTTGRGETVARRKNGSVYKRFQSMLPNGSKGKHDWKTSNQCILDCVYDPVHWTFYVLDVMCWKGYSVYDCDTDFRHFWLQTKVENEMDARTTDNMFYKFKALRPMPMTELNTIAADPPKYMGEQGYDFKLDGLLFYHRATRYIEGSTPLVVWVPCDNLHQLSS
ncbi:hypothetical protein BDB00DRAFT_931258 [Zychaea mexicana]|uniref:uncharacterized protein n=1 Tax=Zychaea mexicana TaxID=64656 RepID=UPI0022FEBCBA|nr:uncharacterized protein BDB00DRAFT_931258 [Zychaea mexicana]KAI9490470.1 hypothetical protein BDB00DRAFT_931258 [Zychaea mexicana]